MLPVNQTNTRLNTASPLHSQASPINECALKRLPQGEAEDSRLQKKPKLKRETSTPILSQKILPQSFWIELPEEINLYIFSFLSLDDHKTALIVSKGRRDCILLALIHLFNRNQVNGLLNYDLLLEAMKTHGAQARALSIRPRIFNNIDTTHVNKLLDYCLKLNQLQVNSSRVDHTFLYRLKSLASLQSLSITWNTKMLLGGLDQIAAHTGLTRLSIWADSDRIKDTAIRRLSKLVNLQFFSLTCTQFTDAGLKFFGLWTQLKTLELKQTQITGQGFTSLKHLTLENLKVTNHSLRDDELSHIPSKSSLKTLDLFGGLTISALGMTAFEQFVSLTDLNLGGNGLTDRDIISLPLLTNLTILNIQRNKEITDNGIASLPQFVNLTHLDMSECPKIKGTGFENFSQLVNLNTLILAFCQNLHGKNLIYLSLNHELQVINLHYCIYITNEDLKAFSPLLNLRKVDLNKCCSISDNGLSHFSTLTNLIELRLFQAANVTQEAISEYLWQTRINYFNIYIGEKKYERPVVPISIDMEVENV